MRRPDWDQLTDEQLLWLLDGDTGLVKGLREMGKRYNGVPMKRDASMSSGFPVFASPTGPGGW